MPSGTDGATSARSRPSASDERRAAVGVVVGEVDGRLRLAAQAQHPARGAAHEHRRLAAARQLAQQRLGPEVLVDVDRGTCVNRFSEPVHVERAFTQ